MAAIGATLPEANALLEAHILDRPELREYDKDFLCGTCSIGFGDIQEYITHSLTDEHNFHKKRNLARIVPGLGFCMACYALMQSELNWNNHNNGVKHKKSISTLLAAEALGVAPQCHQYEQPIGCATPGVLGEVIDVSQISSKIASSYDFGHGGAISKGTPLVGLGYVIRTGRHKTTGAKSGGQPQVQEIFMCSLCSEEFDFGYRAKHLNGPSHRLKFLEANHPERYADVMSVKYQTLKLLYHCSIVEEGEIEKESVLAKRLRKEFLFIPARAAVSKSERIKAQIANRSPNMRGGRDYPRGGHDSRGDFRGRGRGRGDFGGRGRGDFGGRGRGDFGGRGGGRGDFGSGGRDFGRDQPMGMLPMRAPGGGQRSVFGNGPGARSGPPRGGPPRGGPGGPRGGPPRGRGGPGGPPRGRGGPLLPPHLTGGNRGGPPGRGGPSGGRGGFMNHSSRDPYIQDQYQEPYVQQDPYAQDPYAADPYAAQDPYTQDPYAQDPYAAAPYNSTPDPYAADPYANVHVKPEPGYDPYTDPYARQRGPPASKRPPPRNTLPPPKRPSPSAQATAEDHSNPEVAKAMAAISVLEEFAQSQAAADVKKRIDEMRASVVNAETGAELDHLKEITDMADQLKQGTAPTESDDTSERYSGDFHTTEQATAPVTYPGQPPATHPGVPGYQPRDPYAMGAGAAPGYQGQQGHPSRQQRGAPRGFGNRGGPPRGGPTRAPRGW